MKNQLKLGIEITLLDNNGNIKYHVAKEADTFLKQFGTLLAGRLFKFYSTCKDTNGNDQTPPWNGFSAPGYFGVNAYAGDDNSGLLAGSNGGSDVTDSSYASASSVSAGVYVAAGAFDNIISTSPPYRWAATTIPTPLAPEWLKQDFGAGNEKTIIQYTLNNGGVGPGEVCKDWTFEGSNDDLNWDVLDTQTDQYPVTRTVYQFDNTTAYRYYRILITAINGSSPCSIWEMEMMEFGPLVNYNDYSLSSKIPHNASGLYYPVMQITKDSPTEGHESVTRLFENRGVVDITIREIGLVYITYDVPHVNYMIARDAITPVTLAPTDVMNTKYIISWLP
jgi:hypothetical protein